MLRKISRLGYIFMALFLVTGTAHAQLAKWLQVGNTDFLDLYQQQDSLKPKPEIVSLLDFSTKMDGLMFHPMYQNSDMSPDTTTLTISIPTNAVSIPRVTVSAFAPSGLTLSFVDLIKPDGTAVTVADAESCIGIPNPNGGNIVGPSSPSMYSGTSTTGRDVRHWIMAASHIRFTCTADGSTGAPGRYRTIDLPLPWKVMDIESYDTSTIRNPLPSKVMPDPKSGQDIEFDLTYKVPYTNPGSGVSRTGTNDCLLGKMWYVQGTIPNDIKFDYPTNYVRWLFRAKWQSTNVSGTNYRVASPLPNGNYIAFDAGNNSAYWAAGQVDGTWGRGYLIERLNNMIDYPIYGPSQNSNFAFLRMSRDYAYHHAIPAITGDQANKVAVIKTWIKHQSDVYWAFRFVDANRGNAGTEFNNSNPYALNNSSRHGINATNPLTQRFDGLDTGWVVFNKDSAGNMKRLAAAFTRWPSTPLRLSVLRTLAQFDDVDNVFNEVIDSVDALKCTDSFLIVFSSGAEDGSSNTTWNSSYIVNNALTSTVSLDKSADVWNANFSASAGNRLFMPERGLTGGSKNFIMCTATAVAAHLTNNEWAPNYLPFSGTQRTAANSISADRIDPQQHLPFGVQKRKGETVNRQITTMTVGVNIVGSYFVAGRDTPKGDMYLSALTGDPKLKSGKISFYRPFIPPVYDRDGNIVVGNDWMPDESNLAGYPNVGVKNEAAVNFFDVSNPDVLTASLQTALYLALGKTSNNATSSPNLPFIGASFGQQVYFGSFEVPEGGRVLWPGDLRMFGTKEIDGNVHMTDKNGNVITDLKDDANCIWAASKTLADKKWHARTLYTRLPGGTELKKFNDSGNDFYQTTTGLVNYVGAQPKSAQPGGEALATFNARQAVQLAMGGNIAEIDENDRPLANRADIMGDIINSAPAAIEYSSSVVNNLNGRRFRLVLVGTNQGWLHAFGEYSKIVRDYPDPNDRTKYIEKVEATVEELWAFMPTDFLADLEYMKTGLVHRFMVDGSPSIYHLDVPAVNGGIANGIVDKGERVIAVFGLGKGGRSYYALNIEDPFNPKLQWSLVPDEYSPTSVVGKFGFSTATPAFGRVVHDNKLKDAVFLSGGFSVPEIEAAFPHNTSSGATPLGRSIIALDVYNHKTGGTPLAEVDLSGRSGIGPIGPGLIPFEFILNSGAAQRAYFLDYHGGLWVWGDNTPVSDGIYTNFRNDTSNIQKWSVRKVYQDNSSVGNRRYTTPPAPFRVGNFPGKPHSTAKTSATPAAAGIAMVSGDRNNPMDYSYGSSNPHPVNHRLTVVFDRQDNEAWSNTTGIANGAITDGALMNLALTSSSAQACTHRTNAPCFKCYLAPGQGEREFEQSTKFGYYYNFPAWNPNKSLISKGINPPLVVSNALFYTIFTPESSDPCAGGFGASNSFVIANVMEPLAPSFDPGEHDEHVGFYSQELQPPWAGVASNFIALGTRGVLQGGVPVGGDGVMEIKTFGADPSQGYPKPRVWRVIRQ